MKLWLSALLLLQAVISVQTELVTVPVTVTDSQGRHVRGLGQESFRVVEDGRLRPIAAFVGGDADVTLGLVVDRSQSMRSKTPALVTAVSALLRSTRPGDELFAVDVNDRVSLVGRPDGQPFTQDIEGLQAAVVDVRAEGRTALYDAVAEGLQHLQLGHAETRALVVISDGGDNASERTYAEILALVRQSNVVIDAIGLFGTSTAEEDENPGLLKRLCRDTGGVAYFPRTDDDIAAAATEIAGDLRAQYLLGFVPADRADGPAFRKIAVTVSAPGRGRLHVRARTGYLLPAKQADDDRAREHTGPGTP